MNKRCLFLEHAISVASVSNVQAKSFVTEQRQNIGQILEFRESFDIVVVRLLQSLRFNKGGLFVAAKGVNAQCEAVNGIDEETVKADDLGIESDNESENFSDIDDIEVATYLYNEEEKRCKKIIWEYMNREYLEEQAAKEAEAAAREAMMAKNGSSQVPDAVKQLYDEASANYAKLKKGRQQKRAAEAKNPQTAAEAAHQMLSKKRISSKLNHDRLKELFDEPVIPDNLKRSRTEAELEKNAVSQTGKSEVEGENDEDELETVDEIEDEGDYQGDTYHDDYEEYADFDEGFL